MREFARLFGLTLVLALAVVLMLALFPYLRLIGFVLLGLLGAGTLGGLLLGGYRLWDYIAHKQLDRARKRLELALLQRELDYVRPNEHGPVTAIRTEGGYQYPPRSVEALASPSRLALPAPPQEPGELEPLLPHAPHFREMCHLLTRERLVLCYTASGPAFGAVEDLLSMAVVGKPGRGKTTALLYYVAILLYAQAEVHVWDPHGSMSELAQVHPRLSYLDSLEDLPASITYLRRALEQRDMLYKQRKQVQHPLLLLVDELPVIGDVEKVLRKRGVAEEQTPTFLIKRFVLEARKWRCFFIAAGQSTDAEILPTRVTENLSSRIIFFSSDRRARMAGLEQEAVKKFLPVIRRAGPGVMIFDCSSWDEPVLGAIPETTVEDLHDFFFGGMTSSRRFGDHRAHDGFHHAPIVPSGGHQTSAGGLFVPENVRKHSQQPVAGFPAFPTNNTHTAKSLQQAARLNLVQETSGRPGSPPEATGNIPETAPPIPDSRSGSPSEVARELPKTKAISRDLYHRIKAEYDHGTPKSEVCGRLRIGNDYYSTIRAMYQQFDLEKQQAHRTTGNPFPESEDT